MRAVNKYKTFFILGSKIKRFPLRILRFKRPKWLFIKKLLVRALKKRIYKTGNRFKKKNKKEICLPVNLFRKKSSKTFWERLKKNYKNCLFSKKTWSNSYDNNINEDLIKRKLKKKDKKKDYLNFFFLFFEFRVDLLLWNLNYFSTTYEACIQIRNGLILVNGLKIDCNTYLQKGDIITFVNSKMKIEKNFQKYNVNHKIFTGIVEIDYYTNTIVILKSYTSSGVADFSLLSTEYIDVKRVKNNMKF